MVIGVFKQIDNLFNRRPFLTKNSILYILNRVKNLEGRLKLMKLMFLLEHYDFDKNKLTNQKIIGNNFIIYHHGPFSFEVYNELLKMIKDKTISEEGYSIRSNINLDDIEKKLPENISKKIKKILSEFGEFNGFELENKTMNMLNIKKEEKSKFLGTPVEVIISNL